MLQEQAGVSRPLFQVGRVGTAAHRPLEAVRPEFQGLVPRHTGSQVAQDAKAASQSSSSRAEEADLWLQVARGSFGK